MTTPPGFSTYGAVDLGALAAQRAARERAAAAAAAAADGTSDGDGDAAEPAPVATVVTEETFQADVIDRSFTAPVVVDFWAEWCGPCKQLSPLLEKLAVEAAGAWVLATVDTDANPRLAQAFQIQSIPTVYVVWQGQLVPGFAGALPEAELRRFMEQVVALRAEVPGLADPAQGGPGAEGSGLAEAAPDPLEEAALDALDAGDLDAAADAFRALVAARPDDSEARLGLGRVELMQRIRDADPATTRAAADAAPDDVPAQTLAADVDLAEGRVDEAIARLVDLVRRTSGADRDAARDHLVGLFGLLGDGDPRVAKGRTALANALF